MKAFFNSISKSITNIWQIILGINTKALKPIFPWYTPLAAWIFFLFTAGFAHRMVTYATGGPGDLRIWLIIPKKLVLIPASGLRFLGIWGFNTYIIAFITVGILWVVSWVLAAHPKTDYSVKNNAFGAFYGTWVLLLILMASRFGEPIPQSDWVFFWSILAIAITIGLGLFMGRINADKVMRVPLGSTALRDGYAQSVEASVIWKRAQSTAALMSGFNQKDAEELVQRMLTETLIHIPAAEAKKLVADGNWKKDLLKKIVSETRPQWDIEFLRVEQVTLELEQRTKDSLDAKTALGDVADHMKAYYAKLGIPIENWDNGKLTSEHKIDMIDKYGPIAMAQAQVRGSMANADSVDNVGTALTRMLGTMGLRKSEDNTDNDAD